MLPSGRTCVDNARLKDELEPKQLSGTGYSTYVDKSDIADGIQTTWFRRMFGGGAQHAKANVQVIRQWKRTAPFSIGVARDAKVQGPFIRELELGYTAILVMNLEIAESNFQIGSDVSIGEVKAWLDANKVSVSVSCESRAASDLCVGIAAGRLTTGADLDAAVVRFGANTESFSKSLDQRAVPPRNLQVIGYQIEDAADPVDAAESTPATDNQEPHP